MQRIDAKMGVLKAITALNLKNLPMGMLDHLTDLVLTNEDPAALAEEFAEVARAPVGKPARRVRKLIKMIAENGVPRTMAISASIG